MSLPKYIHGTYEDLPKTLAKRVSYIRNARGIHISDLSKRAGVNVDFLEEIEAGIETWLSVAVRQRIARVLKVDPGILEEVEIKTEDDLDKKLSEEIINKLKEEIMTGKENIKCPLCNHSLRAWIQEGFDLNDNLVGAPKAHCKKCTFQLRDSNIP